MSYVEYLDQQNALVEAMEELVVDRERAAWHGALARAAFDVVVLRDTIAQLQHEHGYATVDHTTVTIAMEVGRRSRTRE